VRTKFATETSTRLVSGGAAVKPVWSPDGKTVVFAGAVSAGFAGLFEKPSNGAGDQQLLASMKPELTKWPWDWSPDGRWLLYSIADPKTKEDLWVLPMQGERKPEPFLATDYTETEAAFSPDGRFVAYVSDDEREIRSLCALVSGRERREMGDLLRRGLSTALAPGRQGVVLFCGRRKIDERGCDAGRGIQGRRSEVLFQAPIFGGGATTDNHYWDVAPDGKRFLINIAGGGSVPVTVVLNWPGWTQEMTPGTKLGPYSILEPIGAGGMGEVWKARDTRLDRMVAVKVFKIEFTERFEREARAVAALNKSLRCLPV
jgi:hypothetical protein